MRLVGCLSLAFAVLLLVCCGATSTNTDSDQTKVTKVSPIHVVFPPDHFDSRRRIPQSDGVEASSSKKSTEDKEDRGIIPANVKEALKKLKTKDDTSTIYTGGVGKGNEQGLYGIIVKWYRRKRYKLDFFFRNAYWEFRFMVWAANRRTPEMMYNRLRVFEATGPYDKNYRIYINYLRFYEFFKGPTYNPITIYGPKFKTE